MAGGPARRAFTIDVVSDVVCPWCYIGKRRLAAALARLDGAWRDVDFQVSWHPFQLNPDLPAEGVDRQRYVEDKFGGPARAAELYARVRAAGESAGIHFDFDRIARQPNTLDAHRLIAWAQQRGPADTLVETLFRAHFIEGQFLGDRATLAGLAGDAGLDANAARAVLDSVAGSDEVRAQDARVRELGVTGVPFFIFDSRVAVSGAQEAQALAEVIDEALRGGAVAA